MVQLLHYLDLVQKKLVLFVRLNAFHLDRLFSENTHKHKKKKPNIQKERKERGHSTADRNGRGKGSVASGRG